MERGTALEPGNADGWDRVGRERLQELQDPRAAIPDFERALRDNPRCPYCWTDLAQVYEAVGDDGIAETDFEQAEKSFPVSPDVAWLHGNLLLEEQRNHEAFPLIRRAVKTDRSLLGLAISRTWRATNDVDQMLHYVIPRDPDAYFAALHFFASEKQLDAGMGVWKELVGLHQAFPLPRTFPFINELIREDRSGDARLVWRQALEATGRTGAREPEGSIMQDGRFTTDFANGGLGWRWNEPVGAVLSFDAPPEGEQGRSLRVDFSGGVNLDLHEPSQVVPVEPSRAYVFFVKMRTDEISTESGLRFIIVDPNHAQEVQGNTVNFTGSHPWTPVRMDVKTGPNTHFLEVRLSRSQSRLFESKLSGTVWIADVSLTPAAESEPEHK